MFERQNTESNHNQIPRQRQILYYGGIVLNWIGLLLILSSFFITNDHGDFLKYQIAGGIILLIVGGNLKNVGLKGLAGSGIVLNPERARQDIEPWSRMAGGVAQDALSEVGVVKSLEDRLATPQIKVRCIECHALNDESSKFCNQCGAAMCAEYATSH